LSRSTADRATARGKSRTTRHKRVVTHPNDPTTTRSGGDRSCLRRATRLHRPAMITANAMPENRGARALDCFLLLDSSDCTARRTGRRRSGLDRVVRHRSQADRNIAESPAESSVIPAFDQTAVSCVPPRLSSMVVIRSAPLASIAGGVLPTLKHCPTLFNEQPCLTGRKIQNVAFVTVGHVDSIELVREFPREPDFHGRTERSNTRARTRPECGTDDLPDLKP
jgi:hypothetical protein